MATELERSSSLNFGDAPKLKGVENQLLALKRGLKYLSVGGPAYVVVSKHIRDLERDIGFLETPDRHQVRPAEHFSRPP